MQSSEEPPNGGADEWQSDAPQRPAGDGERPGSGHPAFVSDPDSREQAQLNLLLDSDPGLGAGPANWQDVGVRYLYRRDCLVVRDEYLTRVTGYLVRRFGPMRGMDPTAGQGGEQNLTFPGVEPPREARAPVVQGVTLLTLPARRDLDTLAVLEDVRTMFGPGVAAVDHLVHIAPPAGTCPASEPVPLPPVTPPDPVYSADRNAGEGVRVVVIDTGLDPAAPARNWWMAGVTGDDDPKIQGSVLAPYAGHGTFAAGIVRCVAPGAEVIVRSFFRQVGSTFESQLVGALDEVLRADSPDIISMSAGTYSHDATGLLCFQVFNETRLRHHKGVALVVAAGNDSTREQFWPAAAPYTVSVGALGADRRSRAGFSNFGGWVDVYAPGEDLVNAYPAGDYTYREPPKAGRRETFDGVAMWSGTSFATPVVSGLIAARMSRTGENGRDAAAALLATARVGALPGVGAVLQP